MPAKTNFTCTSCHRGYQRKLYYNRHVLLCELMRKSVKERQQENEEQADTPTLRVLYDVILELTHKLRQMEGRVEELAKWADVKKRKINILEWLNTTYAQGSGGGGTFETLLGQLNVTREHLDYLFRNDYVSTIVQILQENLPIADGLKVNPLKAFEQKTNVLYAYCVTSGAQEPSWCVVTDVMFQKLLFIADKKLLGEFIKWQTENAANMADDDFAIKYALNVKKAMGGSLTREQIYSRVKIDMYKYLKVCMKVCLTENEFV